MFKKIVLKTNNEIEINKKKLLQNERLPYTQTTQDNLG